MKSYNQLTDRGRALRLRRMALAALERYDLDVKKVRLVTNDLNGIFRADTAEGAKLVLRIGLPAEGGHPLEVIRSEMMWLAALRRDTGLRVPQPVTTRQGTLVTTVEVEGVPEPRHCVLFTWVPGPDLADRLSAENVALQGEFAARLHAHAATFAPPDDFDVRRKDKVLPYKEPFVLFARHHRELMPPSRHRIFEQSIDRVQEALQRLRAQGPEPMVIHNDLHQWNVKVYRGQVSALDFEDLMWGCAVQDIAVSLYYYQGYDNFGELRQAFQRGYVRQRPWPEQYPGQIDTFLAWRGLTLANFLLQDPNPSWRGMAPEFMERVEGRLRAYLRRADDGDTL